MRNVAGFLLSAAYLLAGCAAGPRPNILIIVIDTLRADRVDFYEPHRGLTPFLGTLAARGDVFWNAYAQCSWTMPSIASLWTSRYQSQHRITEFDSVLSEEEHTLAEILKQHGYVTGGFVANSLLPAQQGFGQGFDRYETFTDSKIPTGVWSKTQAERVNAEALKWLDTLGQNGRRGTPTFLYLHYMEPHFPYLPRKEELERVLSQRPNRAEEEQTIGDMFFVHPKRWGQPDALALAATKDLYDAEVMSLDGKLRELFAELGARGFLAHSIVVITADHGQELFDHGFIGHGRTLYDEVIHVPLLFLLPGQRSRVDIRGVVSLVDLAPTVLDLINISPPPSFEGRSQRAALCRTSSVWRLFARVKGLFGGPGPDSEAAYSELAKRIHPIIKFQTAHTRSLVVGSRKLIVDLDGSEESYDLQSDPGETNGRGLTELEHRGLAQALDRISKQASRNRSRSATVTMDEQTKERMRALGYANSP